jgi:hypothetical protein
MVESLDTHQGYRTRGEIAIAPDVMNVSETQITINTRAHL